VPDDVQTYTCEQCGKGLKRKAHSAADNQPAQLNTQSGHNSSSGAALDELPPWVRKYGGPIGLVVLGLLFILIGKAFDVGVLALPTVVCFVAALYWLTKNRSATPAPVTFSTTRQPDEVRQHQLQEYLSQYITVTRGRVESVTPYSAVVVHGQRVNHVLHLLISIFLCGLWLPVWLVVAVTGGERRTVMAVDHYGNVTTSR
jgi:hypothetical protein